MRLSRRGYARHRGCSESAVRQALDSGRITLAPDGLIDPVAADREWAANTDPMRSKPLSNGQRYAPDDEDLHLGSEDMATVLAVVSQVARRETIAWQVWSQKLAAELANELKVDRAALEVRLRAAVSAHMAELNGLLGGGDDLRYI